MKMEKVAKNFGLCMVGFIGGSIVTSIGVIHLVKEIQRYSEWNLSGN